MDRLQILIIDTYYSAIFYIALEHILSDRVIFLISSEGYGRAQVAKDSDSIALLVPLFLTEARSRH